MEGRLRSDQAPKHTSGEANWVEAEETRCEGSRQTAVELITRLWKGCYARSPQASLTLSHLSSLLTARQVKHQRHPCPRMSRLLEPGREACVRREMDHDFG